MSHAPLPTAVVRAALRRTEAMWKRPGFGLEPYDPAQAEYVLDTFFAEPHSDLELCDLLVEDEDEQFSAVKMRIRYWDPEDGVGIIRWFVWRPDDEDPNSWVFQEDEGW